MSKVPSTPNDPRQPKVVAAAPAQPGTACPIPLAEVVETDASEPVTRAFATPLAPAQLRAGPFGRYRIIRLLKQGGMGAVYLAHEPNADRIVALKVPRITTADGTAGIERFLRGAKAAASVSHPALVAILEVGQVEGTPFLTMPYLEGQTLAEQLRDGPLDVREAARFVGRLAEGLQAAHEKGILHRDLTTANVLRPMGGEPILLDFGLARQEGTARLTRDGQVLGTPGYVAPELLTGQVGYDTPVSDVFSLGVLLYVCLTGQMPFGSTMREMMQRLLTQELISPSVHRAGLPAALDAICGKALARQPAARYPSMAAFAADLNRFLGSSVSVAGGATEPGRTAQAVVHAPVEKKDIPTAPGLTRRNLGGKSRWRITATVTAGLLLTGLVVLWAAGVFKLKTQDGTIVVENLPADAEVFVDGEKVALKLSSDAKLIEIQVAPGKRKLEIKTAGFKMETREVTLASGERKPIEIRLEPLGVALDKPAPPAPTGREKKDFVPLFNGKDLTGWRVERDDPKSWGVERGVIVAHGTTVQQLNYLLSDRDYGDFVLRLEFNLEDHAGSGVVLRAVPGELLPHPFGQRLLEHPVFRLEDQPTRSEVTGTLHWVLDRTHVAPNRVAELAPPRAWNKMEIEVKGRSLRASVNGKPVSDITLAEGVDSSDGTVPALNRAEGRIGLLKHHGTARFRNIEIKELPAL